MQNDYLSSLAMSLCESVPVWQLEKLQPHSCNAPFTLDEDGVAVE